MLSYSLPLALIVALYSVMLHTLWNKVSNNIIIIILILITIIVICQHYHHHCPRHINNYHLILPEYFASQLCLTFE